MSEPDFNVQPAGLEHARVVVLGLGLMGGSLALGLAGHCRALDGIDTDPAVLASARGLGVFHQLSTNPLDLIPEADVVLLAAPITAVLQMIGQLPNLHPGRATVMDIGSTKVEIARRLEQLPERFTAVGGHPMCGKERSGLAQADPDIFRDAPFVFTKLRNTSRAAERLAEEVTAVLGARSVWLDPESHDALVAATSHVPYFLSAALVAATPAAGSRLIGSGFRSAARLAGSSPEMMTGIVQTNRAFILEALRRIQSELTRLESLIKTQADAELADALRDTCERYCRMLDLE